MAFANSDNVVEIWDTINEERTCLYQGHSKRIKVIRWLPDGRYIATGSEDTTVQVWDTTNGKRTHIFHGPVAKMRPVAISPDGQHIAWMEDSNDIEVWNTGENKHIYTFIGHTDQLLAIEWSPNGTWIVSLGRETVQVWNAVTGKDIDFYRRRFTTDRTVVAWSPDSMRIAFDDFKDYGETVNILNASSGSESYVYRGHSYEVEALTWSPDGTCIASASRDAKGSGYSIQVWKAV